MRTSQPLTIVVTEGGRVTVEAAAPVASIAALVALKLVSMPRRSASNHPEKVAGVHDLVRLVEGRDLDALAQRLARARSNLRTGSARPLVRWFSSKADQRYTLARLRRLSGSIDAQAVDEDSLGVVAMLDQAVLDAIR